MQPAARHSGIFERGNALFLVLIAIVILGLLTYAISQDAQQQSGVLPQQTIDNQINQMITYASALGGALQQMAVNGENANTMCTTVDVTPPSSDAGFNTPPSNLKLYHPLGGGITYQSQSSPDANAVATSYNINPGSTIAGVGCSPGITCSAGGTYNTGTNTCSAGTVVGSCTSCSGHMIFTAMISASKYCAETNKILTGSNTVPTMSSGAFSTLFASSTAVTINAGNCASCVNVPRLCVTNGSGAYGFYADLFPPQNSNSQ